MIGLDFMGPFPERKVGKKRFVLVIVDMFTRHAGAWAVIGVGGNDIVRGFKEMGTSAWDTFSLMFRCLQSYSVQGAGKVVHTRGSDT